MQHRTLVKIIATKHCLIFRTISRERKSPHAFYILRDEFEELEDLLDPSATFNDICSFAELRRNIPKKTITIRFTWLSGSEEHLNGWVEAVTIPYENLIRLARRGAEGEVWNVLSIAEAKAPRLVFSAGKNIRAAAENKWVRRKLAKCLRDNFRWQESESIQFYDDLVPYSFSFREIRNGQPRICGGLILHGQENMKQAYYAVHT